MLTELPLERNDRQITNALHLQGLFYGNMCGIACELVL